MIEPYPLLFDKVAVGAKEILVTAEDGAPLIMVALIEELLLQLVLAPLYPA